MSYYTLIKLMVEVWAFIMLTIGIIMLYRVRKFLLMSFGRKTINMFTMGALVVWLGYLANVMNDIFPTEFTKVFDDFLVALGLGLVLFYGRSIYGTIKLKLEPKKVLMGNSVLQPGVYLVSSNVPVKKVIELLKGRKILVVARNHIEYKKLDLPVLWITKVEGENTIHPTRLAPLLQYLIETSDRDTAIILDGVEYLILENSFESIFKFLTNLKDNLILKESTLIVRISPESMKKQELQLLEKEFEWLSI